MLDGKNRVNKSVLWNTLLSNLDCTKNKRYLRNNFFIRKVFIISVEYWLVLCITYYQALKNPVLRLDL